MEKTMSPVIILTVIAAVIYAGILISIPFRVKKIVNRIGELKIRLESVSVIRIAVIFIVCAGLLSVVPLRSFPTYIAAIFLGVALLGAYIASNEALSVNRAGIYQNGLIFGTEALLYDKIEALPTLAYEKDSETTMVDYSVLQILKKDGGKAELIFSSPDKREEALSAILEACPRLKA